MKKPKALMQYHFNNNKTNKPKAIKEEFWDDVANKNLNTGQLKLNNKNDSSGNVSAKTNWNTNVNSNENMSIDWFQNFDTPRFITYDDDEYDYNNTNCYEGITNHNGKYNNIIDDYLTCKRSYKCLLINGLVEDKDKSKGNTTQNTKTVNSKRESNGNGNDNDNGNVNSNSNGNGNIKKHNSATNTNTTTNTYSNTMATGTYTKKIEKEHLFAKTNNIDNARAEKFNNFINKYNKTNTTTTNPTYNQTTNTTMTRPNAHSMINNYPPNNPNNNNSHNNPNNNNNNKNNSHNNHDEGYYKPNAKKRSENLYAHAKMKVEYLERLRLQEKEKKLRNETNQCTFWPKTNKRSRSLVNDKSPSHNHNVYDRNISWANNKTERIHNQQNKKLNDLESYSFKPNLHVHSKEYNSKKSNESSHISTVLFINRQEKAREIKSLQSNRSSTTKYRACSTEPSSNNKMKKMFMNQWKAILHEELFNMDNVNDEDLWTNY